MWGEMSKTDSYLLEFLIDGTSSRSDAVKKAVAKALGSKYVSSVEWSVIQTPPHFKLSIKGSLEDVDTCHERLNQEFVSHYSCIRLRDDAGEEIRQQAYPILAHIEQRLRAFINRAMIEVKGFDWWNFIAPFLDDQKIRDDVQKVKERIGKKAFMTYHPLELTLFDELISIMTGSIQRWPTSKPLSAGDLLEILSDSSSLEDIQKKLEEKTRKVSLWDDVFARYFADIEKWVEMKKTLIDVIPVRNKVMHHRPMHIWELRKLQETRQNLDSLLESAVTKLSDTDRAQALRVSEDWLTALASTLSKLARPVSELSDTMESLVKQQGKLLSTFREQTAENAIQQFWELLQDRQEQIGRAAMLLGQSTTPLAVSSPGYIGSTHSTRFHRLTCRHVNRILPENQIRFANRDDAMAKGYVPCRTCNP